MIVIMIINYPNDDYRHILLKPGPSLPRHQIICAVGSVWSGGERSKFILPDCAGNDAIIFFPSGNDVSIRIVSLKKWPNSSH